MTECSCRDDRRKRIGSYMYHKAEKRNFVNNSINISLVGREHN